MKRQAPLLFLVTAALAAILASACGQSSSGDTGKGGQSGKAGSATSNAGGASADTTGGSAGFAGSSTPKGVTGGTTSMTGGAAGSSSQRAGASGGGTTDPAPGGTTAKSGGTTSDSGGSTAGGTVASSVPNTPDAGQDSRGDAALRETGSTGREVGAEAPNSDAADPNKKIKVWIAGDSTVMNCTDACPCGWGSQFQPLLNGNASVVNSAVGGRSIQTWLYDSNVQSTMGTDKECVVSPKTYSTRWQDMLDPTDGMKPGDYLLIEFGINDGDSTCPRHVGTALFQSYLGTMAQAAKKAGAQTVFLTSTSYIECSGSTAKTNRGFVAETKTAGTANNVPVIDLTALSAAFYTSQGLCPNSSDYTSTTSAVGKFFCEDHTHFESAGATQIAKLVAKALKDQGIGLAAYLR